METSRWGESVATTSLRQSLKGRSRPGIVWEMKAFFVLKVIKEK